MLSWRQSRLKSRRLLNKKGCEVLSASYYPIFTRMGSGEYRIAMVVLWGV